MKYSPRSKKLGDTNADVTPGLNMVRRHHLYRSVCCLATLVSDLEGNAVFGKRRDLKVALKNVRNNAEFVV